MFRIKPGNRKDLKRVERRKTALVVSPDGTSIAMGLGEDWQAVLAESALISLRLATE